ncbi:heterodisulfide reductase-related iron-sulfur binding cluster [Conexibacter stalactiti]|uniref:Glycolate oxidase iron-sulfur subunit n=1 Tax=Conexibacter stalactiti TaxID=1940611 RepID=A0ABU4HZ25_9ACTN|nr:heterodisulfide reductase-related iron-sulfur binding cluster [Conexibacter stalactiti]MDW5598553.1 heterodisulfide reductase-related iron-sulfur binding cluster [Conexibacter stalactiti]MEC5039195.1 heterodisulfide reductase-related iron-sulfur binding cluster [Conexibacter stalactiti]
MAGFDLVRQPEPDLIEACVHCGFCLPTCPTYLLWGEEADSPRGRIVLMRAAQEEGGELTVAQVDAWDNCLGCMACVTACPSGVQYGKLIEDTRGQVERNWERTRADRLWRDALFALFPHPGRLRALAPLTAIGRTRPAERIAARLPDRLGRVRELLRLAPRTPLRAMWRRLPERTRARGSSRGQVGFVQGCVQRVFFGDVNAATVAVLAAEGFDVFAPRLPRCCGALQLHSGDDEPARELARATIAAFERCDAVVANAAGCGSAMKDYGHLLRDDPAWAARARAFSAKVRDVTELLAAHEPRAVRQPLALTVAYHDACHLAHAQGVRAAPRELLRGIPGLELLEPEGWEICCGSAGLYNLLEPEPAAALGRQKAERLLATGAQAVAAANPGCALQLAAHTRALGRELPIHHPIELLHASITGRSP